MSKADQYPANITITAGVEFTSEGIKIYDTAWQVGSFEKVPQRIRDQIESQHLEVVRATLYTILENLPPPSPEKAVEYGINNPPPPWQPNERTEFHCVDCAHDSTLPNFEAAKNHVKVKRHWVIAYEEPLMMTTGVTPASMKYGRPGVRYDKLNKPGRTIFLTQWIELHKSHAPFRLALEKALTEKRIAYTGPVNDDARLPFAFNTSGGEEVFMDLCAEVFDAIDHKVRGKVRDSSISFEDVTQDVLVPDQQFGVTLGS